MAFRGFLAAVATLIYNSRSFLAPTAIKSHPGHHAIHEPYVALLALAFANAAARFTPHGDPKPVTASHPGPAENAPFDPLVMS